MGGYAMKRAIIIICSVVLLAIGGTATYMYLQLQSTFQQMNTVEYIGQVHASTKKERVMQAPVMNIQNEESFSVLLLGVDKRKGDKGRSDTILVLTVNPTEGTMKLISVPRDTRTEIIGYGITDKINHAYAFGGVQMAADSVAHLLDIPINYFMSVDMEGFIKVIDTLGGITVNNDMRLVVDGEVFEKGEINLNAKQALQFSRIRYEDPRGDFGRQLRQRLLIEALMKHAASPSSILKANDLLQIIAQNVQTNITQKDIMELFQLYADLNPQIEQLSFDEGYGIDINGIWYYKMNAQELAEMQQTLQQHLGI